MNLQLSEESDSVKPVKIVRNMDYCNQTMVELCKKMGSLLVEFERVHRLQSEAAIQRRKVLLRRGIRKF